MDGMTEDEARRRFTLFRRELDQKQALLRTKVREVPDEELAEILMVLLEDDSLLSLCAWVGLVRTMLDDTELAEQEPPHDSH